MKVVGFKGLWMFMVIGILMSFDGYGSAPSWRFVGFENHLRAKCIYTDKKHICAVLTGSDEQMSKRR